MWFREKVLYIVLYSTLFHVASSKSSNWHYHCPPGETIWCLYQQDKISGYSTYKPSPGLPLNDIRHGKSIYEELSADSLLKNFAWENSKPEREFQCASLGKIAKNYLRLVDPCWNLDVTMQSPNCEICKKSSVLLYERLGMIPGHYMTKQRRNYTWFQEDI